jgi:hypothetical protein
MLTKELVLERFQYIDGAIYWKTKAAVSVDVGKRAGGNHGDGYRCVSINNKRYLEHRIIFLMHYGYLPQFIDHIDCNKQNNKIENLREASIYQNNQNTPSIRSASGVKGVYFNQKRNKYHGQVWANGKCKSIGYFDTIGDAAKAVSNARFILHGDFANSGNLLNATVERLKELNNAV